MSEYKEIQVKMAKASEQDIAAMSAFFQQLEFAVERGEYFEDDELDEESIPEPDYSDERLGQLVRRLWKSVETGSYNRVIWGCDMLIRNCCDPEMDVLEWRKDIREWLEAREASG